MARRARLVLPDVPLHIIQRGNNRSPCFFSDADYRVYLDMLRECAEDTGCDLHAYVLMTNHVHLLISPSDTEAPGSLMRRLGQRYVQYVNRRQGRSGTLWEGRFRSSLVDDERYLLVCQRYIELNPVRAGIVSDPESYQWSSYRTNALGAHSKLLTPHAVYAGLARDQGERLAAYRGLFKEALSQQELARIRQASNGNFALGTEKFTNAAAAALGRTVLPIHRGKRAKLEENCT